ncbi:multicopper oxidase domain-containing protein [Mariniphaga sp.]|uniref:multicopper oxidase domain-containing protein n=1 Tax=Mariniphaga sp. TaxID=1954475 RepID=UPI003561CD23
MKTQFLNSWIKSGIVAVLFLLFSPKLMACEACNRSFLQSILADDKFNSLVSKELRASIASQSVDGISPAKWVNDVLAMQNLTVADLSPSALNEIFSNTAGPVTSAPGTSAPGPSASQGLEFLDVINRDKNLSVPPTSYVPQNTKPDKYVRLTLEEGETYIGNGVIYKGFTVNKKIPGPTVIVQEGDIVSLTMVNDGDITHGASIHAVYSQTSKYLGKIAPGDSATIVFQANTPGVYMYHCAPGGHAIPMHIIFGQYGMIVVEPKKKYEMERILNKKPDIELYLVQHEYYASGKDAVDGQGKPMYTAFNGKLFRYIEEPIVGKPGDYVRIYFLNAGPNLVSTFHIVGIIWDFAYWQGNPENRFTGGQTVTAGPSDSWVIEFRIPPDEGNYLMLSHAVGSTDRGALGYLVCDPDAETPKTFLADGIEYSETEMEEFRNQASRIITPFGLGSDDVEIPVVYGSETSEVTVQIIGNSFYPKVVQVAPGTTIKWVNEDVFAYMEGEFSGIHNVIVRDGPEIFYSPLLAHTESFSQVLNEPGEYVYICAPHPYMEGKIIVKGEPAKQVKQTRVYSSAGPTDTTFYHWSILAMAALALVVSVYSMVKKSEKPVN